MKIPPALLALLTSTLLAHAEVTPSPIFQNHAVLQAGKPVPVWGQADAGERVTVSFAGQKISAVAGTDGAWKVALAPLKISSKPATLTIAGKNTVELTDVLVGEVWLASGQSNMEFKLSQAAHAGKEIAAAKFPLIRQLDVRNRISNDPESTFEGQWVVCSPETAGDFTAVGFFFARDLYEKLGVPIGIINSTWGGTNVEAWMSAESIAADPDLGFVPVAWQAALDDYPAKKAKYDADMATELEKEAAAKAVGKTYKKRWMREPAKPDGSPHVNKPSALYNAMIHPLLPVALAGVIWYQGENNVPRFAEYRQLFPNLITGWRAAFGQGDLPFYWVQLPNFGGFGTDQIAGLREAQTGALRLPATGQAVTIDLGESHDIHPMSKQDVGHRIALLALRNPYGKDVVASGPVFTGATFKDGAAQVTFGETHGGMVARKAPLAGFELAGEDRIFTPAEARISGNTVIVSSSDVPNPVAVRYAWHNDPPAGLYNEARLPATPFRSDTW